MISVRPGTFARRVLELVVQTPGVTSRELAAEIARPPAPRSAPFASATEYSAWRAARVAELDARKVDELQVSRVLGRLQEARLVETRRPPRLAPWVVDEVAAVRAEWGWIFDASADPQLAAIARVVGRRVPSAEGLASRAGIVARLLVVEKLPTSARSLLGRHPSGARQRAYRDLVAAGIIEAPTQRWPTQRGIALVGGARLREVTGAA